MNKLDFFIEDILTNGDYWWLNIVSCVLSGGVVCFSISVSSGNIDSFPLFLLVIGSLVNFFYEVVIWMILGDLTLQDYKNRMWYMFFPILLPLLLIQKFIKWLKKPQPDSLDFQKQLLEKEKNELVRRKKEIDDYKKQVNEVDKLKRECADLEEAIFPKSKVLT